MADIGEVPSPALVVRATPKEMQMRPAAQQRYCRRRLRIMHQGSDAGYLRVSYELSRNPPDTPTTATMNPMVRRMIMIRVSGLLIEDMRTAVCIRFCVAAKERGEREGAERAAGGNEASASCSEAGRERERAGGGRRGGKGAGGGEWARDGGEEENEMQKMTKRKRK